MYEVVINEAFLQRIEVLQSVLKNNIAGMFGGNHTSKTLGSSCEYVDYRNYMAGDDITKIDWNAYARTEELFLKLYLDERQLHTRIYIDVSRSMDFGNGKKAQIALEMAAMFAYISVCELDRVSVYTVSESKVTEVISDLSGKERFYTEIGKLNDIVFGGDCFLSDGILPTDVGYGDGRSIVISDFLTDNDYENAIDYMADKRRDLLCVQVLSAEELNPNVRCKNIFYDSENERKSYRKNINRDIIKAYREAVRYVTERLLGYCAARGAGYLLVQDDMPLERIFFEKLTGVGVLK
ncbi:MAG: DUF58 domain-containing protein [Clostridiales bacterium]|nr:DUF58 domain-containing protein [Clostridiales bacterium]